MCSGLLYVQIKTFQFLVGSDHQCHQGLSKSQFRHVSFEKHKSMLLLIFTSKDYIFQDNRKSIQAHIEDVYSPKAEKEKRDYI